MEEKKLSLPAVNRDGYKIQLLPDAIDITGLGWDVFRNTHVSFDSIIELFREVKEVESNVIEIEHGPKGIAKICEIRRFDVKLSLDWFDEGEDSEETFRGFFFKDQDGDWIFRMKGVKRFYEGTVGERWSDGGADAVMDGEV